MDRYLLNEELVITIPDGFRELTEEEFEEAFPGHKEDVFGVTDEESGMTAAVFWNRSGRLYTRFQTPQKIFAKLEPQLARWHRNYGLLSNISGELLGNPSEGIRYEYEKNEVPISAETIIFRSAKSIYIVYYFAPKDGADTTHKTFYKMLKALRLSSVKNEFPEGYEENEE